MADGTVKLENEAAQSTNALGPLIGVAREDFVSAVALLLRETASDPSRAFRHAQSFGEDMVKILTGKSDLAPDPKDKRFQDPAWQFNPFFRAGAQYYLAVQKGMRSWLEELDIPLAELLERPLEEAIAERKGEDLVGPVLEAIDGQLAQLREAALDVDKSLAKPFDKTRDHISRGLDTLSSKIAAAVARRHDVWLRRLEQVKGHLEPGGTLQERRLATGFLWSRHGDELVNALYSHLDLDPRRLSVARLD